MPSCIWLGLVSVWSYPSLVTRGYAGYARLRVVTRLTRVDGEISRRRADIISFLPRRSVKAPLVSPCSMVRVGAEGAMVHPGREARLDHRRWTPAQRSRSSHAAAGARANRLALDMRTNGRQLRRISSPAHHPLRPSTVHDSRFRWPSRFGHLRSRTAAFGGSPSSGLCSALPLVSCPSSSAGEWLPSLRCLRFPCGTRSRTLCQPGINLGFADQRTARGPTLSGSGNAPLRIIL